MSERRVPLGEIVTTHGIDGRLKLKPYNPQTALLSEGQEIFLEREGNCFPYLLQSSSPHKDHFLIKLKGLDSIDQVEPWVGSTLSVAEEMLQPLKPGEYYHYQAVGLDVLDTKGKWIGKVTGIWSKEGGDLYVVSDGFKEYLIPAVKEVIEKIDLPGGKMIISPPPGLLDL